MCDFWIPFQIDQKGSNEIFSRNFCWCILQTLHMIGKSEQQRFEIDRFTWVGCSQVLDTHSSKKASLPLGHQGSNHLQATAEKKAYQKKNNDDAVFHDHERREPFSRKDWNHSSHWDSTKSTLFGVIDT